jgi:molybdopterin converting factor small subunit
MKIRVRLSAGLAPFAGNSRLVVNLAEGATVTDLLNQLQTEHPALAPKLGSAIPMVSGKHAGSAELLTAGQEVALLLPAAGGSK